MKARLVQEVRFLDQSIDGRTRLMVLAAALLLAVTYFVPLWNLTMFAPQYQDGLRLDIYSYALAGGNGGQDVKEINVLNHYIGMHHLENESFEEFQWMPFVIGAIVLLLLRAIVHGTTAALVDVTVVFFYFGAFSAWSFGYKLYQYGHDLAPGAAIKVDPFMPPMFGYRQIANFEVYSYPRAGTYAMVGAIALLALALARSWLTTRRTVPASAPALPGDHVKATAGGLLILMLLAPPWASTARAQAGDSQPASGTLEGRPATRDSSPLQARIDQAAAGARIVVPAGTYEGDLYIDRPLTLAGEGRPVLRGSGRGSVVSVRAPGVTIEGFEIDGRRGGDLGRDTSGIHVAAPHVTIRDCLVRDALFGIYLREADDAIVERTTVIGIPDRPPGEIGSGIHVWNSQRFRLTGNEIVGTRDGIYIQSSSNGVVRGNRARDLRYGLHYMFSDDNVFEDNSFENGAAGTALMYSKRLAFRRNRFFRNRGFASVGLLLKACDDVIAEDNLIADNARGIFLEGSYRNQFRRNVIVMSDTALVVYDSSGANVFEGNSFVSNLTPLSLSGRRTDTRFVGNYWSDHMEPDLDGDGGADRPYRLSNVFDHVRGNLTAADLFAHGAAALALSAAERAFPVLDPVPVVDPRPLARPPMLPQVPAATRPGPMPPSVLAVTPWLLLAGGTGLLAAGRRGWRAP